MTTQTLTLGDTSVTRIGLGTNRLTNTPANVAFVREAVAAGVNHIDTAHLYTSGGSEAAIGVALASGHDGVVATKGGYEQGRPATLRSEIEESFHRLRAEVIDLYYLHRVHPDTSLEDSISAIAQFREAGRIGHVGISAVSVQEIERARLVVPIAAVQNRYNLSDRAHDDVVDYCAAEGIPFVPYFPLGGQDEPVVARIADSHGASARQIALAWLLRRSPTMLPIPGTLSIEHLRENLAALEIDLTTAEFEALTQI
jgi:aryl-alcohol dehydrogenase-like predicted oxidoreductase